MTNQQIQELVKLLQDLEHAENKKRQVLDNLRQVHYHLHEALDWLNNVLEFYTTDENDQ